MRRVVVTGMGAITPIGVCRRGFWEGLQEPASAVRRVSRFDASPFRCQVAGQVAGFDPSEWIDRKPLRRMDRYSRFSVAAAQMAVADAQLDLDSEDRSRVGCFLGSALGGVGFGEIQYHFFHTGGIRAVDASIALAFFVGAGSCNIAIQLGINGPTSANADNCASGAIAIGRAMEAIRCGEADVILAGGAEAPLTPLAFASYDAIGQMPIHFNDRPEAASRPFDASREGCVMGEGAAILVLESEDHARRRGASILAEVAGMGITDDAYDLSQPRPDGSEAARAIRLALSDAGIGSADVDAVSAHGVATRTGDVAEVRALKTVFSHQETQPPVFATKSRHGHALGASSAIETAISVLALHHQWLPGPVNLDHLDPECQLNIAPGGSATSRLHTILKLVTSFGGVNTALVIRGAPTAGL